MKIALLPCSIATLLVSSVFAASSGERHPAALHDEESVFVESQDETGTSWSTAGQVVGGPHGTPFSDASVIRHGQADARRIAAVRLAGCDPGEHLSSITFDFRAWNDRRRHPEIKESVTHGTYHGTSQEYELHVVPGAYISRVGIKTWRRKYALNHKTRVGWISFETSDGKSVICGTSSEKDPYYAFPAAKEEPMALLFFSGSAGRAVDSLQTHFVDLRDYLIGLN